MHCSIHNIDYAVQCSVCEAKEDTEFRRSLLELEEEIEAQKRHLKSLELQRDEMYQRQNPGEYDCPYCRYAKVKRGSLCCPACQGEITFDQWRPIYDFEKAQAIEWAKAEAERQRTAAQLKTRKQRRNWPVWVPLYVLPILTVATIYWIWMR
jgi:ribosomal protein L37AE/L43A